MRNNNDKSLESSLESERKTRVVLSLNSLFNSKKTNMKNNIDDAFIRRFNSILKFPFPEASQRALIWKKSFKIMMIFLINDNVNSSNFSIIIFAYENQDI